MSQRRDRLHLQFGLFETFPSLWSVRLRCCASPRSRYTLYNSPCLLMYCGWSALIAGNRADLGATPTRCLRSCCSRFLAVSLSKIQASELRSSTGLHSKSQWKRVGLATIVHPSSSWEAPGCAPGWSERSDSWRCLGHDFYGHDADNP